jgi:hypothetical protein
MMEDVESDDAVKDRPGPGELIREASMATDKEDAKLVYDHTCIWRDKVRRQYFRYYHGCRIILERGATIEERALEYGKCWMPRGGPVTPR